MRLTGDVTALVCFLNSDLEYDRADLPKDFNEARRDAEDHQHEQGL